MDKEKLVKLVKFKQDPNFAIFSELLEMASELKKKIEDTRETEIELSKEDILKIKGEKGERGEKGEPGDSIVGPQGPMGSQGVQGKRGESIVGPKGDQGDSIVGPIGPKGDKGDKPKHEWHGTSLRFENPDNTWGPLVNLKGSDGESKMRGGGSDGTPSPIDPNLFIQPTVSLSGGGSYEKGQVVEDVDLSWVCNKTMATRNLSSPVPEADRLRGEGQNGTYTHTGANISTNTTYSITVSDTINSATATTSLSFKLMFYWGASAEESLNNSEVLALNKELKTASEEIEFSIDGNGEYLYFIYPTEWGAKDIYVNGFVVTEWELSVVPITNPFGDVTNYNMVRSTIKQNGDNIIITLKQYGQ